VPPVSVAGPVVDIHGVVLAYDVFLDVFNIVNPRRCAIWRHQHFGGDPNEERETLKDTSGMPRRIFAARRDQIEWRLVELR